MVRVCINCGDFVDYCTADECFTPNGGPHGRIAKFYIGSTYCRHKRAQYGHEKACAEDCKSHGEDE